MDLDLVDCYLYSCLGMLYDSSRVAVGREDAPCLSGAAHSLFFVKVGALDKSPTNERSIQTFNLANERSINE